MGPPRVTIVAMAAADLRIVSLLPAATEIAWALGLEGQLVGRSHECDWPAEATRLPALTRPRVDPAASSRAIHEAVGRAVTAEPGTSTAIFELDIDGLAALEPDVILTQATCDVCAIAGDDVVAAVRQATNPVRVVHLSATSLAGLWADIVTVGRETGRLAQARELVARLQARCDSVACRVRSLVHRGAPRPKVAVIEWLDPPMAAGNWVPELVRLAGGEDCLGRAGEHSHWIDWAAVAAADPDLVILSPCGFTLERIMAEVAVEPVRQQLASLRATATGRLWAIDGHHLLNRPGPRLVDSLEVLAGLLWPGAFQFSTTRDFARAIAFGSLPAGPAVPVTE
jgi:iron complex transport system substrate-binding protein